MVGRFNKSILSCVEWCIAKYSIVQQYVLENESRLRRYFPARGLWDSAKSVVFVRLFSLFEEASENFCLYLF